MKGVLLEKKKRRDGSENFKYLKDVSNAFDLTEIMNGAAIMAPSPFSKHQKIVFHLAMFIQKYAQEKGVGEVYVSPLDVILEEGVNRLQPDLIFIKNENLGIVQDWIRGAPDLVVEIASKGSITVDSVIKKEIYERYGVGEFWLVLPEELTIQVYSLENNRYKLFSFAEEEGTVKSHVIGGLVIDIKDVFKE